MRKEIISTRLNKIESKVGLREPAIIVFHKDFDKEKRYTFELINGKQVYYDNGIEVTEDELKSRCENLIVWDIHWVESPHKNDNI